MRGLFIYFVNLRQPKKSEIFYLNNEFSKKKVITGKIYYNNI